MKLFYKKYFKDVSREFDEFRVNTHLCKLRCYLSRTLTPSPDRGNVQQRLKHVPQIAAATTFRPFSLGGCLVQRTRTVPQ